MEINLANEIVPEECQKVVTSKKIELRLKKKVENVNWMGFEKGGKTSLVASAVPINIGNTPVLSYPTSNKQAKDWNKIDTDITKQLQKEKPEGDEALNTLFK